MPRPPRLIIPGLPYHVIQRGNNRKACFFSPHDYRFYLDCIERAGVKYGCPIHAYALLTNHVHLLFTPTREDSLQKVMQSVGKRYVYYVNKNYGRTGRLWESRYRPFVVETERYLLACYRYTDLNPVNAGLVDTPEKYPWSSFAHHALGVCNELISPHPVYLALGRNPTERQRAYRRLFDEGVNLTVDDLVESQGVGLQVIGTRRFRSRIERLTGRRLTPRKRGRPKHGKKVPGTN